MEILECIWQKDLFRLGQLLSNQAFLANEGLPYDDMNTTLAHPLHRICDAVFSGKITDDEGVDLAKLFLMHGANVNGGIMEEGKDTPLIAAASLHADKVGILLLQHGADIKHAGTHGGTALHWAAWCGRPLLLEKLIEAGAPVNRLCGSFLATPLYWSLHAYNKGGQANKHAFQTCVKMLLNAGADAHIPNYAGITVFQMPGYYEMATS
jgi:uncharacterized protein